MAPSINGQFPPLTSVLLAKAPDYERHTITTGAVQL